MNWKKLVYFVIVSLFIMSCGASEEEFDEANNLAKEAVSSRDSLRVIVDSLQGVINSQKLEILSFDMSYSKLDQMFESLRSDNASLRLRLYSVRSALDNVSKKEKPKVKPSTTSFVVVADTTNKKPTSIFDFPVSLPDTVVPKDVSSFIDFMWEKRSRVEP